MERREVGINDGPVAGFRRSGFIPWTHFAPPSGVGHVAVILSCLRREDSSLARISRFGMREEVWIC